MIWRGRCLESWDSILDEIVKVNTRQEAQNFLEAYAKDVGMEVARENIGYYCGHLKRVEQEKIYRLFNVTHPFLGNIDLTPEEIFALGQKLGEDAKKYGVKKAVEMNRIKQPDGRGWRDINAPFEPTNPNA